MDTDAEARFLDLAYGAAVEPELWPTVVESFADLTGAHSGALIWQNQADRTGTGIGARLDPSALDRYFAEFSLRHPTQRWMNDPGRRIRHFVPRIVADDDAMPKQALMRTDFYNGYMRAFDMHTIVRVGLTARHLDAALLMISRPRRLDRFGEVELGRIRRLHAHLVRAFELSQKIAPSKLEHLGLTEALDRSPFGLFLLDGVGHVRHVNRAGEALVLTGSGLTIVNQRLSAATSYDNARLSELIARAAAADAGSRIGGGLSLRARDRTLPLAITVSPVGAGAPMMMRGGPFVIVCATDLDARLEPSEQRLRELFGFTPAELRVAAALAGGASLREAAEALGVSFFTVRGHLIRMFDKTGTHRQSELVRLMERAAAIGAF